MCIGPSARFTSKARKYSQSIEITKLSILPGLLFSIFHFRFVIRDAARCLGIVQGRTADVPLVGIIYPYPNGLKTMREDGTCDGGAV